MTRETKKIVDSLQRFAEYQDLKDLYQKCIPQIAKFEHKILEFDDSNQHMKDAILDFDKHLISKTSKAQFEELQNLVLQNNKIL